MKRVFQWCMATTIATASVLLPSAASAQWVSGFYAGWDSDTYPPSAVDYSALTHVMMFSAVPQSAGTLNTTMFIDQTNGPLVAQEVARRAHAAGKKAILVLGGAGTEAGFQSATSASVIDTFVRNIVATTTAWGYDGVDIDWEPLLPTDYARMLSLIAKLRAAAPGATITADVGWMNVNFALSAADAQFYANLAAAVDQMNIMSYEMADNWGGWVSWHSSALTGDGPDHPSSVASSARAYMQAGVPAAKLGMGIGFYGSCWSVPTTAPLQPLTTSNVVGSDNTFSFRNIKQQYFTSDRYHYDSAAQAPYLSFATATGPSGCTFISYEDETSIAAKGAYAQQNGLGGTIIWQLAEGYDPQAPDPNSLLHAVGAAFLGNTQPQPAPQPVNHLLLVGGTPQTTVEGSAFAQPLQVKVVDGSGNPIAGVTVTFTAPATGARATFDGTASSSIVTGSSGIAEATAIANTKPGTYVVVASVAGVSETPKFSLTNAAAGPLREVVMSGSPQSTRVRTWFAQPLKVQVRDAYGNPLSGVAVVFQSPTSGASATFQRSATATVVTNANGNAISPSILANGTVGTYNVTATVKGTGVTISAPLTNTKK